MTVLFILKIIGIVLLAIIGLVLAILLLVLFCPFFYQVRFENQEKFEGTARLTWLFGIIRCTLSYKDKLNIILRVFGIPVYNQQKKKDKEKNKNKNTDQDSEETTEEVTEEITEEVTEKVTEKTTEKATKKTNTNEKTKTANKTAKETTKDTFIHKIKRFFQRVFRYLSELPEIIIGLKDFIGDKCQKLLDTLEYYQNLAEKPGTRKVILFLKKEITLILRHLKPYRGKVFVDYQSDDPAMAAKVMQLYAVTMPILPKQTRVSSVFAKENNLQFQVIIKGRFYLFYLGFHALKIICNKKLKRFISLIKREE